MGRNENLRKQEMVQGTLDMLILRTLLGGRHMGIRSRA